MSNKQPGRRGSEPTPDLPRSRVGPVSTSVGALVRDLLAERADLRQLTMIVRQVRRDIAAEQGELRS